MACLYTHGSCIAVLGPWCMASYRGGRAAGGGPIRMALPNPPSPTQGVGVASSRRAAATHPPQTERARVLRRPRGRGPLVSPETRDGRPRVRPASLVARTPQRLPEQAMQPARSVWERLPCAHGTSGGAKFPLGRQRLARFGRFPGQSRDWKAKLRQIRQVPGLTTQN